MTKLTALVMLVLSACGTLVAQENKPNEKIAKYVYFEDAKVNPGKYRSFAKSVATLREASATSAPDVYWITASAVTGENGMFTFVTFQNSMADVEKFMTAIDKAAMAAMAKDASWEQEDAESSGGAQTGLAKYNEEISYRPDMVPMAETAYWSTEVLTLRPGCSHDFNEAVKQVMDLHKKAGDNEHWIAYNAVTGPSLPAVIFVKPMKSLAEEDEEPTAASKELFQSPAVRSMLSSISKECITHVSASYSKVEPSLSRPMQSLVTANPSFWTVKEEAVSNMPAKKGKMKKKAAKETKTRP